MKNKYNNGGPQDNSGMPGVDMEDNYNYDGFGHNINMMTPLTDRSNEFSLNHSGDVGDTPYQHNMSNIQAGALTDNCCHHHRFAASIKCLLINKPLEDTTFRLGHHSKGQKDDLG